jgi:small subunit ribosomal protein S4e
MARGPKKHLKRITAPKSWMLDKLGGTFAPRPSQGPHKLRESIPLTVIVQHRLKYALNGREVKMVLNEKEGNVFVDGKVRRDEKFPAGFMDVLTIKKTGENFRVLYDVKGKFVLRSIKSEEAKFKLCKVTRKEMGPNRIPYVVTHDGRTIRFPHPDIAVHDTLKVDVETGKILDVVKFETGNLVIATSGNNIGRVGVLTSRDRHLGGFDIVHIRDARGHTFATRIGNVFIIGKGKNPLISLPKEKGIYLNPIEARQARTEEKEKPKKK